MKQPKLTFDEFIDKYLGRDHLTVDATNVTNNRLYTYSREIEALVVNDIESKNEYTEQEWYQEHRKDIRRLLKAAVITTIWATGVGEAVEDSN